MIRIRSGAAALLVAVATLAACGGGAPPNDVAEGVGFQDYAAWQARRAQLRGEAPPPVAAAVVPPSAPLAATLPPVAPAPAPVTVATAPAPTTPDPIAARAAAAIAAAEAAPRAAPAPAAAPVPVTLASAPLPAAAVANPGISDEQDFAAVSGRETIESDAERLARMQAERVVIQPTAVPDRPEGLGPNIIDYALATTHPVGEARYSRRPVSETRHQRACIAFRSADLAQEWFLQNGGPGRDRQGLDPDGDGYACAWNPAVYRAAAAAARN
ncbi:hypothetical protein [Roseicyclus persicicus]|uniref:Excalibur calcium-binding domain-containing protein n=1 Tax=Roseicyclus persicicus TaxID=2650661 RepID=A0A7X6JYR3_9RHOB|nr:hypothetical protein [Roseibacterium persicicum]NKX44380.1 hypothetical protein [Roseibacterium persicicum]